MSKKSPSANFKPLSLRGLSSFVYALFQIGQGLLFHPYQTMQSLVRQPIFSWLVFLPLIFLVTGRVIWHWLIIPIGQWLFSPFFGFGFLTSLLVHWVSYFCWLWQLVLLYLLVRFFWAFWERK